MKKLLLLVLAFSLALVVSAQRNTFYYGDKNTEEIANSTRAFDQLIADYEESISSLQKENERMTVSFQKSRSPQFATVYAKRTAVNDSLISLHQSKVFELREAKGEFLERTAGNPKRRAVSSKGNNPEKLAAAAEAYAIMRYVDAYTSGRYSTQSEGFSGSGLKGLIVNDYYQKLTVTVRGPAGSMSQFNVAPNGGRASFSPRMPGSYTFYFSNGRVTKAITKDLKPGFSEFYDEDGSRYDLMAIMPRGY